MLKNVLFDLDRKLTDPGEGVTACIRHALIQLERPSPPADQLARCIGPPLSDSFAQLLETDEKQLIDLAIDHYRQRFVEVGMFENRLYPDIVCDLWLWQRGRGAPLQTRSAFPFGNGMGRLR